jgi:hypothetical protein
VRKVAWLIGVASAIGFAAWLIGGWGGKSTVEVVDDLGLVGFALFAAVCSGFAAWKSSGRQRVAWICFSIGAGGWVVGSALWAYYELWADVAPFPSLADAGYLILPVAVCVGLVFFPVGYTGQSQTRRVLDGLIFAGALFEVVGARAAVNLRVGRRKPFRRRPVPGISRGGSGDHHCGGDGARSRPNRSADDTDAADGGHCVDRTVG